MDNSDNSSEDLADQRALERINAREKARVDEQRVAAIVRKEIDRRIEGLVLFISFAFLIWWKGFLGFGIWLALLFVWGIATKWIADRKPGGDEDKIEMEAEDFVRHSILADLYNRGEASWEVEDGEVQVADHKEWSSFWSRLESVIEKFEKTTPRDRMKKLKEIKSRSYHARVEMEKYAKEQQVKPCWWARIDSDESHP